VGVSVVVRYGEDPRLRHAVRVAEDEWTERGCMVNYYADRTPPMPWNEVGECWSGTRHPVVAAEIP